MSNLVNATRDFIAEWALNILILLFGTTTLVQAFIVPSPSMEKSVLTGDHLLVDKLAYAPAGPISGHLLPYTEVKRGDIIVFRYPMDISQNYVKRVIGVPGDRIRVENKDVILNGKKLVEPYAEHIFPGIEPYRDNFPAQPAGPVYDRAVEMLTHHVVNGELVVPVESYFAMGDNRDNSLDSRYWGFVPRENIIGKPLVIFWSYEAPTEEWNGFPISHFVDLAEHFFTRTRWDRTLKLIRGYPIQ
ncbi:MAG TPA: signal peptidase I [Bryobacteraceae bacterium]|nr:signal peptidase I [Bryobacteraceae bacterium]